MPLGVEMTVAIEFLCGGISIDLNCGPLVVVELSHRATFTMFSVAQRLSTDRAELISRHVAVVLVRNFKLSF